MEDQKEENMMTIYEKLNDENKSVILLLAKGMELAQRSSESSH